MDRWSENNNEVPKQEPILRMGGPQGEDDEAAKKLQLQQKKAEVRKRLEEAGKKGKTKKGFLTPERKKKLRKLLMIKAADNLKNQQKQLESERNTILSKRLVGCPDVDSIEDKNQLEKIYNDLFSKMVQLEDEKYDINMVVSTKDSEINELTIAVNDLRGKFVKPTLKKVSKYDNKFKKLAGEVEVGGGQKKEDFRSKLKVVKKENAIEAIESKTKKTEKPEWSKKPDGAPPKPGSVRRQSAASSKNEEPPAQPAEAEVEEDEEEEAEE